jgi:hypothetical protein
MIPGRLLTVICVLSTAISSCVPRQIRPVSEIDPAPMLEVVTLRRNSFENGLSGILEADFVQTGKRFRGKAYITVFPDGPFRLEIPGPMGTTLMVMVNNGQEVTAYYPEERKAYLSLTDGLSTSPHLPFPFPVEPKIMAALLVGTVPGNFRTSAAVAYLLDSGEKQLRSVSDQSGLEFTYLFTKGPAAALRFVNAHGHDLDLAVFTSTTPPYLPESFIITTRESTLRGEWEEVTMFRGDKSILLLDIPESVHITDLRGTP